MTNYKEEQDLEIEALQSIFADGTEFCRTSDTEFVIKLVPCPTGEQENHVGATLSIAYTPEYPDTAPDWDLKDFKGLSEPMQKNMKSKVEEVVESSLGMAMVYNMAEVCQDFLKENNHKALSMHEEMMKRLGGDEAEEEDEDEESEEEEQEEPEWKGLAEKALCEEQDRLTTEAFSEWKIRFDQELIASGVLKRGESKAKTGKLFFLELQNGGKEAGAATAGSDGAASEGAPLVYDATLFGEGDDDDMDDLDNISGGED
eukprot:CAMPEP_0170597676 /NCGR_PEP_ID=MMETSP0224-20130122/15833_1 /TAXON_ID=285029 /ORGANISM="Togula jolla, Strain CCCM 725" /LENGTH=258 /DNA_ID=CAMNT_0010922161 /DNA_START=91 /DNA_END=867 /DNA_ORIENTATION=+